MNLRILACSFLLSALACAAAARGADDVVLADFEGSDYGAWQTTGTAFGPGPAHGTLPGQMEVTGYLGHGLANSYYGGDKSTGTLTSPPFSVNRRYIAYLIGGGGFAGRTCINLLIEDKVVRTATGPNTEPGGSEELSPQSWDVADLVGKTARIQIVDNATGGWGHINVDQIVLTDAKPHGMEQNVSRQITLEDRYLNFPVKTGAAKRHMTVTVGGQTVREFDIELANADPEFWAFLDVTAWKGKPATLTVDKLPEGSRALDAVEQGDSIKGSQDLYREPLRPQFHFTTRRGWINDPNGLVFHRGEYHLFYQLNPYGWGDAQKHWGHAVSPDLVHWDELPIALYPRRYRDDCWSGSAVVDAANTSGFKTGDDAPLVAAFTSTGRGECIVYSNDRGRTWSEFAGNPVVRHRGRDPRLLWYAPGNHWVMALYDEVENTRNIAFYTSPDLKRWTFASRIEGFFECPDLFELPLDGNANDRRWVLTAASSEYRVGRFDGRQFTPETPKLLGQRGDAMYAAQTFSDVPPADGRRIQIGWGRCASPGMPFNQMMCFPCELTLHGTPDGPRMFWQPVKEIERLWEQNVARNAQPIRKGDDAVTMPDAQSLDITAQIEPGDARAVGVRVHGFEARYDVAAHELICGGNRAPLPPDGQGRITLRLLVDRTSIEVFANDGAVYMPMAYIPRGAAAAAPPQAFSDGDAKLDFMTAHVLRSAWLPAR